MTKAVISLSTGLEDAEKVTVAFLVAVGAAEEHARGDVPVAERDAERADHDAERDVVLDVVQPDPDAVAELVGARREHQPHALGDAEARLADRAHLRTFLLGSASPTPSKASPNPNGGDLRA